MKSLTIGKLAAASEVSADTIRFYEREALLPFPVRSPSGYRLYDSGAVSRLRFIRRAKQLGFTLDEIRSLLALSDQDAPSARIKQLTDDKLRSVESKIRDLQNMRDALKQLSQRCDGQGHAHACPIIDALNSGDATQTPLAR